MNAGDRSRLLLEAQTPQDLLFRLRYNPEDNTHDGNLREHGVRFTAVTEYIVPDFTRIFGKDTSHWDGNINQVASKAAGVRFMWAKAMDGTVPTKNWVVNKTRAREAGMLEGPYHWLYPDKLLSCKLQATTLHNLMQSQPKSDLPLMEDWEWTKWAGQAANPNMADLELFVDHWLNLGNRKPILYTAFGYSSLFGAMPQRLRDKFAGVCVASYGGTTPSMPLGWSVWDFWQFTAHAEAMRFSPNDAGKLNLDLIYARDAQTLQRLSGVIEPEPEEPPIGDPAMPTEFDFSITPTNSIGSRVRADHNLSASQVGSLPFGKLAFGNTKWIAPADVQFVCKKGDVWLQVVQVDGKPLNGWIAEIHYGVRYATITELGTPDPEPQPARTITKAVIHFSDNTSEEVFPK